MSNYKPLEAVHSSFERQSANRFDGNLPVLTAFKVFDPMSVPKNSAVGFKTYGAAEVKVISRSFLSRNAGQRCQERGTDL